MVDLIQFWRGLRHACVAVCVCGGGVSTEVGWFVLECVVVFFPVVSFREAKKLLADQDPN